MQCSVTSEGTFSTMSEGFAAGGTLLLTTLTSSEQLLAVTNVGGRYRNSGAKIRRIYFWVRISQKIQRTKPCLYERPSYGWVSPWQKKQPMACSNKSYLSRTRKVKQDFVRTITGEGVTVALGHSNTTLMKLKKAVDAGASVWVHG